MTIPESSSSHPAGEAAIYVLRRSFYRMAWILYPRQYFRDGERGVVDSRVLPSGTIPGV